MSFQNNIIEYGYTDENEFLEALKNNYSGCFGSIDYEDDEL